MKTIKKYALGLAALAFVITSCNKQSKGYTITGIIQKDLNADSAFIYKVVNSKPIKQKGTVVKDGKFILKGVTDTIQSVYVGNIDKDAFINLILENDNFEVTLTDTEIKVEGGRINTMVLGHFNDKEYLALGEKNYELNMKAMNEEDEDVKANLVEKITKVQSDMLTIEDNALFKVMDDTKNPAIGRLLALTYCQNFRDYGISKRRELVAEIEKSLDPKYSKMAKKYLSMLDEIEMTEKMKATVGIGKNFKPVSGVDENGKQLALKDVVAQNKYTLLEFWASWCSPCRAEIPVLKQAYKKFKNKGFEIYSYSIDASEDDWKLALKEEKPIWLQTLGKGKKGEETIASYGVDGIPASFLIDQNGKIVAANEELRGENLEKILNELLK